VKIVIIGANGLVGSKLVTLLRQHGQAVVEAAAGANSDAALNGANVVVDLTNPPSLDDRALLADFETAGRSLIAAEAQAGIQHHVVLSVVGADRMQSSGYFRAKLAQEKWVAASPIPYTILRSTQIFELLGRLVYASTIGFTVHVPPAVVQPVAADDVVAALADMTMNPPVNGMVEIAGAECVRLAELAQGFLMKTGAPRDVLEHASARYFGASPDEQALLPGTNARIGSRRFETWVGKSLQPQS
jgi:uncharacterized protein YbjT (DUF2867 family)